MIRPSGPCPARVMIVGEYPGEAEIREGTPFVGMAGKELSEMLREAGLMRSQCFLTNVVRIRPPAHPKGDVYSLIARIKGDITPAHRLVRDKMVLPPVWEGLELLKREIELCQPHVIIAAGNLAMWALTGNWGITSWRGSMLQTDLDLALDYKPKVIPVYHPSMVLRQWSWRPIVVTDLKRAAKASQTKELNRPNYNFIVRPQLSTAVSTVSMLLAKAAAGSKASPLKLSVDIETRAGHIACIGIAWSTVDALCIPLMCVERSEGYWDEESEARIMYWTMLLLTHPNVEVVGQNFLYDAQYFHRWLCYTPRLARDTMLAQHVCFSNLPKGLDFLSSMYCEYHAYWKDDIKDWDPKLGEDQLWIYNCEDAVRTYEVDTVEQLNIDAMRLREVHDFQQKLFWPVLQTMNRGVRPDFHRRASYSMFLLEEIAKREQWLTDVLGYLPNASSPKQMQELFYDQLGFKPVKNRKTGEITCNDEALQSLAEKEPLVRPLINKITEKRSLGVFLSTFVNAPLDTDGRIRCSFNIGGTETYRFSSSKNAFGSGLNLQNIPSGGEEDSGLDLPNIRELFLPDPGNTFFDIDLASADLRIVTWESDEPDMKAMLKSGLDPYTEIAKEFYNDPSITKKDPRRQTFKSFAHGTNYLGTAKGLAERLGLSVHIAEKTQKWYFGRFPKIKKWQDDLKDQVLKRRMVQNVFGYRCYFFDRIEGTIFNQAAAWIPQSTVGCLINRAYVNIYETQPEVEILLQVHDSLAGQYPTVHAERLSAAILACAEISLPYPGDPLVIPVGLKTSTASWGACK